MKRLATILNCFGLGISVLVLTGCPDETPGTGSAQSKLVEPTTDVLPMPGDFNSLQALYESTNQQAQIAVFPGTSIPVGGLTVEVIDPALAHPLLQGNNDFAVRLGPDGAFNVPVRVSLLLGKAVMRGDKYVVPSVSAFTTNAQGLEVLEDVMTEVTEDGLVVVTALTNHFSDMTYKVGEGVTTEILSPLVEDYLVGQTIPLQMRAHNTGKQAVRVKLNQEIKGKALSDLKYKDEIVSLPSDFIGIWPDGSCKCKQVGTGTVAFGVTGDHETEGPIDPTWLFWKTYRYITCSELKTSVGVSLTRSTDTTHYEVKVTLRGPYGTKDISKDPRVKYEWTSASGCGNFGSPGKNDPKNHFEHKDCSEADEETAKIGVKVTYTGKDGSTITRKYSSGARANEGKTVEF